jgi:glycosyltransferase involved in cell wall biosynthesis
MSLSLIEQVASLRIGSVEYVSPDEIKVSLDMDAPDGIAANAGTPRAFPHINSYVLIASESGYIVGQVEWIAIERSPFPKRKGFQDFGLIDLPFPLRKMRVNPLGILKGDQKKGFSFSRGVQSFPSVGEPVLIPTDRQLKDIVESGEKRRVMIGTSPLAANAEVSVDPDRLFGRHLAVLGNTGSGKSCTVAGLIQWSLDAAKNVSDNPNARFIILDPNGEYSRVFTNAKFNQKARIFQVGDRNNPLQVPLWFWNCAEWCSFTQASMKAQRPLLQKALRFRRNAIDEGTATSDIQDIIIYLKGARSSFKQEIDNGSPFASVKEGRYWGFIELLNAFSESLNHFATNKTCEYSDRIEDLLEMTNNLKETKCKNDRGYNKPFAYSDIENFLSQIENIINEAGSSLNPALPIHEDTPKKFASSSLIADLNFLATNTGNRQWMDFFLARIQTMLSDIKMTSIIGDACDIDLITWLEQYIGKNKAENGWVTVIDLSMVPPEIIHVVTAVIARMTLESLQRYRKLQGKSLPTTLVMEEAHTFIKRYNDDEENQSAASVCCQVFEKIAREGRKYGLGLVLSSQRPSELSSTVLSQCNTFILHRISNDRDQDQVARLLPDNLRGMLRELPVLPSQYAILLGWASELPVLVRMNDLAADEQPLSEDPDFWDVWTGKDVNGSIVSRDIDWGKIVADWQQNIVASSPADEECKSQEELK